MNKVTITGKEGYCKTMQVECSDYLKIELSRTAASEISITVTLGDGSIHHTEDIINFSHGTDRNMKLYPTNMFMFYILETSLYKFIRYRLEDVVIEGVIVKAVEFCEGISKERSNRGNVEDFDIEGCDGRVIFGEVESNV